MTIGQRIRTKREERGLTQDELAKMHTAFATKKPRIAPRLSSVFNALFFNPRAHYERDSTASTSSTCCCVKMPSAIRRRTIRLGIFPDGVLCSCSHFLYVLTGVSA